MNDRKFLLSALKNCLIEHHHGNSNPKSLLNHKAKLIGFDDLNDFTAKISTKNREPANETLEILRRIRQIQIPTPDTKYHILTACPDEFFHYVTIRIGDDGIDCSVIPDTAITHTTIEESPKNKPYVINDLQDLLIWKNFWLGRALVKESVAIDYFKYFHHE
ncbi:hypothetical protein LZL54_03940 [Pseudomonas aeruginosa]|nr:hypothetical protein [Pseudomonas aeruginosa]MCT5537127.1 hypothetical protein [Pseudomonas aeruginosa]